MKKILFAAYSLDVGGIETSLVTLLNYLSSKQYEITLVLEKKQGVFLKSISNKVKIIEYTPKCGRNKFINKIVNLYKRIKFIIVFHNRFDFSCSYATYSIPDSFVARIASKNCSLWVHNDYKELYDREAYHSFFNKIKVQKFKKIIFVSNSAKKNFDNEYLYINNKTIYCNNLLDYQNIIEKSKHEIKEKKSEVFTFLNIGRHDEQQKVLSRIIEAAKILKKENLKFKILFVGDGKDTEKYLELIHQYNLTSEIIMVGVKTNPYPYYLISDCVILTSNYEGYPVVYNEAKLFGIPIITTDVSDAREDIHKKYGIVCNSKNSEEIAECMKKIILNGINNMEKFDPVKYNNRIIETIKYIIES